MIRAIPISEVWAISAEEGRKATLDNLLDPRHGRFYQMQHDYPAPCGQVRFSAEQILVAQDGLLPLTDIRSRPRPARGHVLRHSAAQGKFVTSFENSKFNGLRLLKFRG